MASSCSGAEGKLLSPPPGKYGRKTENLKELAGEHHNAWSLRFNWIQRRTSHQERQQNDNQVDDLI